VITRLRTFIRSRWNTAVAIAALCALPLAVFVAITRSDVALVGLLLFQAVGMVGLVLLDKRALTIDRRVGRVEGRLDTLTSAVRARQPAAVDLGPLLKSLGLERLDAALRHDDLLTHFEAVREGLEGTLNARLDDVIGEQAALHNIYQLVDIDREMPAPVGFAASPRTLLRLVDISLSLPHNRLILECGSGTSTVWLAHACRRAGRGRVVALEHMEKYAQLTRESLASNGLEAWAEVRSSPLEPVVVGEQTFSWYSTSTWADLQNVHLLFVDGPPGRVGPRSRYPAFPLLAASLAEGAVVALDDTQRADEREVGKSWLHEGAAGVQLVDQGVVGRTWLFRATRIAQGVHRAEPAPQAPM
jgi:predicted O-methyltransferase YrrM